jgi:DNA-binding CsgD family transcriptional regulator
MEPRADRDFTILKAIIDESGEAMRLFDRLGRVVHQNVVADALLSNDEHRRAIEEVCLSAIELKERTTAQVNGFVVTATLLPRSTLGVATLRIAPDFVTEVEIQKRFGLSFREAQVARLVVERKSDDEIAQTLGISWHTVRSHVQRVFAAMRCHSRREVREIVSGKA